jgi:hypothetical protein
MLYPALTRKTKEKAPPIIFGPGTLERTLGTRQEPGAENDGYENSTVRLYWIPRGSQCIANG